MANFDTVLTGAETVLDTIDGLRVSAGWPDQVQPPMAWAVVTDCDYEQTGGTDCRLGLSVFVIVAQGGGLNRAQTALNEYAGNTGTKSIPTVLRANPTLDGSVSAMLSIRLTSYGIISIADQDWIGAVFRVEVWVA